MKFNLSVKIVGLVIILSSTFFAILAYQDVSNQTNTARQTNIEKAKAVTLGLDTTIKNKTDLQEAELYKSIEKYIWLYPDILEIRVNIPDNNRLVTIASNNPASLDTNSDQNNLEAFNQDKLIDRIVVTPSYRILRVITPIHLSGKSYGTYQIDFTLETADRSLAQNIVRTVVVFLLCYLAFIILLYACIRLIIIFPLQKIKSGLKELAKGNFNTVIDIKSHDEFRDVADSFNIMKSDLAIAQTTLTNRKEELEKEVKNRTTELEEVKKHLETINTDLEEKVKQRTTELENTKNNLETTVKQRTEELNRRLSELEHMNKLITRREAKIKTILQTSIDCFWITDMEGHFLDVNDAYCRLIGYSREELLKMKITDVEALEKSEETAARIQKIFQTGGDRFETRHRMRDGRIIDVEVSVNYIKEDNGQMVIFVRDITQRKKAEEELKNHAKDLEHMNELMVGRELRMVEMKEEIEKLKKILTKHNISLSYN